MSPLALSLAGAEETSPQHYAWSAISEQYIVPEDTPKVLGSDDNGIGHKTYIAKFIECLRSDQEEYIRMDVSNSTANPVGLTAQERVEIIPTILEKIENSPTLTPGPDINLVLRYASMVGDEIVVGRLLEKMNKDDIETIILGDLPYKSLHYASMFGRDNAMKQIFDFLEAKDYVIDENFFMSMVMPACAYEKLETLHFLLEYLEGYSLKDVEEQKMKEARDSIVERTLFYSAGWMKADSVKVLRDWILEKNVRVDHESVKTVAVEWIGCTWRDPCQTRNGKLCDREVVLDIVHWLFVLWDGRVNEDGHKFVW